MLETYLKGLLDSDKKQELGAVNSDSGVHTEETITTASPEAIPPQEDECSDTLLNHELSLESQNRRSNRESELLLEHESIKELTQSFVVNSEPSSSNDTEDHIEILEKLIVLNKHLQREEELIIRLSSKIKRHEADASGLSEQQVKESLIRVSEQLDSNSHDLRAMENEIKLSEDILYRKTKDLKKLYDDLEEAEVENRKLEQTNIIFDMNNLILSENPKPRNLIYNNITSDENININQKYFTDNVNQPHQVLKNWAQSSSPYNANTKNPKRDTSSQLLQHQYTSNPLVHSPRIVTQAKVHSIALAEQLFVRKKVTDHEQLPNSVLNLEDLNPSKSNYINIKKSDQIINSNPILFRDNILASKNYFENINQRIKKNNDISVNNMKNCNDNSINAILQNTNIKLGPKKLINQHPISNITNCNNKNFYEHNYITPQIQIDGDSNSDTGLSSLGDVAQLGTLV